MAATQERNFAGEAAALIVAARVASLATVADGMPHVALVTPALLDAAPLLLLSELSSHTRNLQANPACSLLLAGQPTSENPQTAPRVTLSGRAVPVPRAAAEAAFLATHPYAALYAGFTDFGYWRLDVSKADYVGGFAAAAALDLAALRHEINGLSAVPPG
jgi:putative heme iron utilization protein